MTLPPSFFKCAIAFSTVLLLLCHSVSKGQWYSQHQIIASDHTDVGLFGKSVSIWQSTSYTYAIAGAPDDNGVADGQIPMSSAGAVYVFKHTGYAASPFSQTNKIYAPVRSPLDNFGASVAIYDNILVIGAPGESEDATESNTLTGAGAVYIYKKDPGDNENWGFVKKLTAPVRSSLAGFGSSVDIEADHIIIGAPNENSMAGSAYIFKKDQDGIENWGLVKKLNASDQAAGDSFGASVAISNGRAVAGAYQESQNAAGGDTRAAAGSAYVFKNNQGGFDNWGQVKKLTAPVRAEYDYFGFSVDIKDGEVLVGAPNEDENTSELGTLNNSGSAYIFLEDLGGSGNWGFTTKLTANVRMEGASFGNSVAIGGLGAFVGAPNDPRGIDGTLVTGAGTAHEFRRYLNEGLPVWGPGRKIHASPRGENDAYGYAVAASGSFFIIGAFQQDGDAGPALTYPGAAYTFFVDTVIPVTLINFEATSRENTAQLSWSTAEESNSSHFEVQRSSDGRTWGTIETVAAANESREVVHYEATDKLPLAGQNFYRLKMVDADSTFTFSKINKLFFDGPDFASFYPNPATDLLRLGKTVFKNAISVKLFNQAGQTVFEKNQPVTMIQTGHLNAGTYVLQIIARDGTITNRQVAIKR